MSLFLHITTGLGLALAVGIRPFTPVLAAGALARSGVLLDFRATSYAFLQSTVFLLVVACLFAAFAILRARWLRELTGTAGVALGGLLFAAVLAANHDAAWPGLIAGALAAALAALVTGPVFEGARARLHDNAARVALMIYADGAALALALVCWFAPPFALVALAFFAGLAWAQRRRFATGLALGRVPR
jgi:Domain of unknown function (DUF4126)